MGTAFWMRRFLLVFLAPHALLLALNCYKVAASTTRSHMACSGRQFRPAFLLVQRIYQSSKGVHCAICRDTPEMQASEHPSEL